MGNKHSAPPPVHLPAPIRLPTIHIPAPPLPKPVAIHIPTFHPVTLPKPAPIHLAPLPPVHVDVPKPTINMKALEMATGIIAGVVSVTPMGKAAMMGITGIADAASHGAASKYLNNGNSTNSTLSLLPGGILAQRIANDASDGKSGAALAKFVPDPVHLAVFDLKTVAAAAAANPGNTLAATRAVAQDNRASLFATAGNIRAPIPSIQSTLAAPAALSRDVSATTKSSLFDIVAPASTLSVSVAAPIKASLFAAPPPPAVPVAPLLAFSDNVVAPSDSRSTLTFSPTAALPQPLSGSTLPSMATAPSSVAAPEVVPTGPTNTLSERAPLHPGVAADAALGSGASTLSQSAPPAAPGIGFGTMAPVLGVAGVLAMALL